MLRGGKSLLSAHQDVLFPEGHALSDEWLELIQPTLLAGIVGGQAAKILQALAYVRFELVPRRQQIFVA
jgi:hypothetical protein